MYDKNALDEMVKYRRDVKAALDKKAKADEERKSSTLESDIERTNGEVLDFAKQFEGYCCLCLDKGTLNAITPIDDGVPFVTASLDGKVVVQMRVRGGKYEVRGPGHRKVFPNQKDGQKRFLELLSLAIA